MSPRARAALHGDPSVPEVLALGGALSASELGVPAVRGVGRGSIWHPDVGSLFKWVQPRAVVAQLAPDAREIDIAMNGVGETDTRHSGKTRSIVVVLFGETF